MMKTEKLPNGLEFEYIYEYDETGYLVKETISSSNAKQNRTFLYENDEAGHRTWVREFNAEGTEENTYQHYEWKGTYDEEGRLTKEWMEGVEQGGQRNHCRYEYDEYGNVCKKTDASAKMVYEYMPLPVHLAETK